jgi:hypothetical protein
LLAKLVRVVLVVLPDLLEQLAALVVAFLLAVLDVLIVGRVCLELALQDGDEIVFDIADAVSSMPKLSPSSFDRLFNDRIQDNLALVYLSSITRTQIAVAEKLNTAAQVL